MENSIVRVRDVMQTSLHMVNGLDSVQSAIEAMQRLGVSSLVIERRDEHDEYGVVTVRDIAAKVISVNRSTERTSVYEVMTKPAVIISAEMNVKYAVRLLSRLGGGRALVGDEGGVVGLVTLRDLVLGHVEPQKGGA
jgi:signal-transduction protein with cAMP-binding, CBS, and nucleotidyltransferase domain